MPGNKRFGSEFRPDVIAFDYETALTDGTPSTKFYRHDFRVTSCAFSWNNETGEIESVFLKGEDAVGEFLSEIAELNIPVVVHNMPFEYGCTWKRFPTVTLNFSDTMRLVQVYDNGGKYFDIPTPPSVDEMLDALEKGFLPKKVNGSPNMGLGLAVATRRLLPEHAGHKDEAYEYLRANGVKKGQEGANLHLLPEDILERYNIGDSENTLRLYRFILNYFKSTGYNWQFDHTLYKSSVYKLVRAEARGVRINREELAVFRESVEKEISDITGSFWETYRPYLIDIERDAIEREVAKKKTERGQTKCRERLTTNGKKRFNVGSNKQLMYLFVDKLGMVPKFLTKKKAPSFRSAVLSQWGDGGMLLHKRRKRLLVVKQAENLLRLSEYDGRWHPQLKACGTKTGRYAGGTIV